MREQDREFFQPLWRRVAVLLVCLGWAMFEWIGNQPFWAVIATAFTLYAYWTYFHTFDKTTDSESN